MNLKQMQYILEIYRCGGVHAAAQKLYVSQPSLSQHLQRAEEELGVRIFDRGGKKLRVTYEGKTVLASFEKMLYEFDQMQQFLRETEKLEHGRLVIGIPPVRAMQFMPILLPQFRQRYPGIEIELREVTSSHIPELLRSGELDMGLYVVEEYAEGLDFIPLMCDDLLLIVQPESEADRICRRSLAEKGTLDIRLLAQQPIILPRNSSHIRDCVDAMYLRYGLTPNVVMEATTIDLAAALAASGIGMTVVSRLFLHFSGSRISPSAYPLSPEVDGYRLGIVCNPAHYRTEAMRAFIDHTKAVSAALKSECDQENKNREETT